MWQFDNSRIIAFDKNLAIYYVKTSNENCNLVRLEHSVMHKDAEILFQFVASHVHRIIQFRHKIIPRIGYAMYYIIDGGKLVNRITPYTWIIFNILRKNLIITNTNTILSICKI